MDLDPEVANRILEPYPELLSYWQDKMGKPNREDGYGPGGIERMHSPVYLREVVRQHKWVTEGPGDYVDPDTAQRIEEILDSCPQVRAERDDDVCNPWTRAMVGGAYLATRWYMIGHVEMRVERTLNPLPYGAPERQHVRELSAAIRAGGKITMIDQKTGRATRL